MLLSIPVSTCSAFVFVPLQSRGPTLTAKFLFSQADYPEFQVRTQQLMQDPMGVLSNLYSLVSPVLDVDPFDLMGLQALPFAIICFSNADLAITLLKSSLHGTPKDIDAALECARKFVADQQPDN